MIVSVILGDERREIGVYCGEKLPPVLMSNDNRMEVTFISRTIEQHDGRGFRADFRFVEGELESFLFHDGRIFFIYEALRIVFFVHGKTL